VAVTAGQRLLFALAALASLTCGTAGQPPPTHLLPIKEHTLPSGLRVVIEQDESARVAGVVLTVDVGSVDDPPGKHGLAHTLEHLVFRAPDANGDSMFSRLVRLGAASFNGETDIETTTYWAVGPRQTLDELLAIVLGRLADPLAGMNEKLFSKESHVVHEEVRRREGAHGWQVMMPALLPPGHPHARAWADRDETPTLSLAELRTFAEIFYRPERMTLVISSPTPIDVDKDLAAKLPPAWRGRAAEPHPPIRRPASAFEPPGPASPSLPTRKSMAISAPELWMAWRVPPATGIAASRLEVIARVVGRMLSRRLDPDGTNDVLDVAAWASPGRLSSAILCRFTLRSANDATRIRDETRGALEALSDVTLIHISRLRWNYQSALTEAILRTAFELDSLKQRTQTEAALVHFEAGAEPARVIDAFAKLSTEDIADFAGRYLKPDDARAVLLLPEEVRNVTHGRFRPKEQPRAAHAPAPEPDADGDADADADADAAASPEAAGAPKAAPVPAAAAPEPELQAIVQAPGARAALVRRLSNGLSVIAMRRPGLPFVSMVLGFHADPQPGDAPGARYAFEHLLHWNLSAGPLDRGLMRTSGLYADHSQETLTAFNGNLNAALDFINEEGDTLHVVFSDPGYNRWVDRMAVQAADPHDQATRAFRAALFGSHPYHLTPTAAAARTLTEREAETWFSRVRRPANGALVIVGDIVPENALQAAEKMLHGWKGDTAPPPQPPAPPAPTARTADQAAGLQILHTNDPRRQSSYLHFGCFLPPVRALRDDVIHHLLSGLMEANLRRRLRLGKGVTYSADVDPSFDRGGTATLLGHLDVDAKATSDAVDVLRDWLDAGRGSPINEKRFQKQRRNMAQRSGLRHATGLGLARSLFYAWNMGWEPAVLDDYPRDLASVTHKDVAAALDACRQSAVISVLGPGQN